MFLKNQRAAAILAVILLAVFAAGCGSPQAGPAPAEVMAEVNGRKITRAEMEAYMNVSRLFDPSIEAKFDDEESREYLESFHLDELIYFVLLEQFAEEMGVKVTAAEKDEHFSEIWQEMVTMFDSEDEMRSRMEEFQLEEAHIRVPVNSWLFYDKILQVVSADISEEDISGRIAEDSAAGVSVTLSHILTETEEEALSARERIMGGESFTDVAKAVSKDGSAAEGGYLGVFPADTDSLLPEFMAAANALAVDELSQPVKSLYGWHLILITERTEADRAAVKETLAAGIVTEKFMAFSEASQINYEIK